MRLKTGITSHPSNSEVKTKGQTLGLRPNPRTRREPAGQVLKPPPAQQAEAYFRPQLIKGLSRHILGTKSRACGIPRPLDCALRGHCKKQNPASRGFLLQHTLGVCGVTRWRRVAIDESQ